jgi:DNA-directed RNA polymerase subunit RPC12/RpoP
MSKATIEEVLDYISLSKSKGERPNLFELDLIQLNLKERNKELRCRDCNSVVEKEPVIDMYACPNCGLAFFLGSDGVKTSIL